MKLKVSKWEEKAGNKLTANGLIRINPNKPEFGSLMLISTIAALSNGFMNVKNRVGFIVGRVADLTNMVKEYGLKESDDFSAKVAPHRIVTLELLESQVQDGKGYREKINPTTGEVLTKNGENIYWKTEVVAEGSDIQDSFVSHDTELQDEAIREFQTATGAESK